MIASEMFDFKEYYDMLAEKLPNPCRFAEVGIADGASAVYMAKKLSDLGKDFQMYWIENFDYGGVKQITEVVKNLVETDLGRRITLLPISSLDAAASFNDGFFDAVFLDSSHEYKQTKAEIILWNKKIKDGGILAGHDYYLYEDVKFAVVELLPQQRVYNEDKSYFESLEIFQTEKKYGVWQYTKNWQAPLRYV